MRSMVSFSFAAMLCTMSLAGSSALAAAQEDAPRSTIRLCSATEPSHASTAAQSATQQQSAAAEQDLPPEPIPTTVEKSSNVSETTHVHTPAAPPVTVRQRMPAGFYPSEAARATLSQMPGPVPVQSAPRLQQNRRGGKPFQTIQSQPTISPYLYLNAGSGTSSPITNYLAYVRPQLDQQDASRQQQREMQQLRNQLQKMSSSNGSAKQSTEAPAAAHYMDTAQFYRGLQR